MQIHYGLFRMRVGLFLSLFLLSFSSCGMTQILGLSRHDAAELLRKGDIGFIRKAVISPEANPANFSPTDFSQAVSRLSQLNSIHPAASFYAGLLAGASPQSDGSLLIFLFCAALESPSLPARREAAQKLIPLILEAGESQAGNILTFIGQNPKGMTDAAVLRCACLYRLGKYDEAAKLLSPDNAGEWEKALALFSAWKAFPGKAEKTRQEIPDFLFERKAGETQRRNPAFGPDGEVRRWTYSQALSFGGLLDSGELAVLSNRLSGRPTLDNLRPALLDGGIVFSRYPELIEDLGRAYLLTPSMREEGVKLFSSWDRLLETRDGKAVRSQRYRLLYYSGRMERERARYAESSEYFRRALDFAPDALQSDACNWYILTNTLDKEPAAAAPLVLSGISAWNDISYFEDVLDRLSNYLTVKRQWIPLLEIFSALESKVRAASGAGAPHHQASLAQYAWILGRAIQEGYLKADRGEKDFFRIAFEEGSGSFYYRAMAASRLGETFAPEKSNPKTGKADLTKAPEGEMDFLLGFFECGAASFALPYIQARETELSVPELRKIAAAYASAGRWQDSLNLVSRYTRRQDYEIDREDLYLFYPRPFRELIEKYAGEMNLGAEILYGLIRTESYFMPEIVSRSGAVGLAQLMTPTAVDIAARIARRGGPDYRGPNGIDLTNPGVNIHIGSYYLRYLTEQLGSPMPALLAYNGGLGRTRRWLAADKQREGGGLPQDLFLETIEYAETREYGRRVLAAAAVYGYLYYGMSMEDVASDIYPSDIYLEGNLGPKGPRQGSPADIYR